MNKIIRFVTFQASCCNFSRTKFKSCRMLEVAESTGDNRVISTECIEKNCLIWKVLDDADGK